MLSRVQEKTADKLPLGICATGSRYNLTSRGLSKNIGGSLVYSFTTDLAVSTSSYRTYAYLQCTHRIQIPTHTHTRAADGNGSERHQRDHSGTK